MPTTFDHSNPRYMTIFATDEPDHNHAEEIEVWFEHWVKRMNNVAADQDANRFGLIFVNHEHDDHDDHEHERDEEEENAVTALAVKFRREYRSLANATTTGYASVFQQKLESAEEEAKAQDRLNQFSSYMFGIPGRGFYTVDAARAWLDSIADQPPIPLTKDSAESATATTAIFFGSTTGNTELIAERVQAAWEAAHDETPPIVNVGNTSELMSLLSYNRILVGVPTWNVGKLQDDWEIVFPLLDQVDLSGKQIAIFGIGDQFGYPDNFQDAIGILGRKFQARGAKLVGYTSTDGYEHDHSVGVEDGQFMGLAIDDINQPDLTDERIENWVQQVKREFA